jgi:hypothetical protein
MKWFPDAGNECCVENKIIDSAGGHSYVACMTKIQTAGDDDDSRWANGTLSRPVAIARPPYWAME